MSARTAHEQLAAEVFGFSSGTEYLLEYTNEQGFTRNWRMVGRTPELALHSFRRLGMHRAGTEPRVLSAEPTDALIFTARRVS